MLPCCYAVVKLANKGVNLAVWESGMSSHDQGVRGPLSVVAETVAGLAGSLGETWYSQKGHSGGSAIEGEDQNKENDERTKKTSSVEMQSIWQKVKEK